MGLSLNHGKTLWSYTGFEDFKAMISESLGETEEMDYLDYYLMSSKQSEGMSPEELENIIPQVKKVISTWDESDPYKAFQKGMGEEFVRAMEEAVDKNEPLIFS